jgi:hypothetical protein
MGAKTGLLLQAFENSVFMDDRPSDGVRVMKSGTLRLADGKISWQAAAS